MIRQTGRPPKKWTDNITEWTELSLCEAVRLSQDRASCIKAVFGPKFPTVANQGTRRAEEKAY